MLNHVWRKKLGENLTLSELHHQFDAVFLGLGLNASKQLGLAHEVGEGSGSQTGLFGALGRFDRFGGEELVSHVSARS